MVFLSLLCLLFLERSEPRVQLFEDDAGRQVVCLGDRMREHRAAAMAT
ncbi:hypothetical protein [Arthrobacter cupressi]|nr:hypothetical protein [Arthrobacter cupressi]NYD77007.1 hypothetical protein [Arthrobacter cupressi]